MMMSDRQQRENVYLSSPVDRTRVGQQKVEDIQKQIVTLENQQKDRADLIHKLNRLQEVEKGKKEIQEKVLERNSRNNSPVAPSRFLQSELDRLYGRDSELERARASAVDQNAVEMVIQHRTKEFSAKQQEAALTAKYLDRERKKLQEARQRVHEQRQLLQNYNDERPLSDSGLTRPADLIGRDGQFSLPTAEAQGVDSYIDQTVHKLPNIMDKIWKMREDLEKHHRFYRKPYNGELGIRSYQHWQLPDYFLCKDIVDDIVEDFLNLYFRHDDVVEPGTYKALLEDEKQWRNKQSDALSEKRAVQLIAEELLLDETGDVINEVIKEMHHMYGTFRNMTDTMIIGEAEMVATGKDHERDQAERAYNMVTKGYFNVKANRGQHRKEVWGHSQYAQNKVKKRQINRKKDGYEEVEEVEDLEEERKKKPNIVPVPKPKRKKRKKKREEEDVDAPDLTILDFNTIPLVSSRSLPPSYIDSTEIRQEKEAFRRFKRRELDYWNKMVPQTHSISFHAKCNGINLIRVSPNHRFVAIGTFHGDLFVCDALTVPWRPFRALAFHARKDRRLIDIAWSLDSTRIITIDIMGYLQVASIVVGHANPADAMKMALPRDDKGIYAHDVQTLLELDVMREDFIFQQGTMADEGVLNDIALLPRKAAFFPSLSFLGSQNDIIIGMEEGDMLKCNIQNSVKFTQIRSEMKSMKEAPRIYKPLLVKEEEASDLNTIGQNVEAELLRGHKKSVVYIGFVEHLNAMITVDGQGYIYKWKYNEKTKSSFGWYTPARKYKIERAKIMYKESGTDKPKVVFTDHTAPGKKPKTRQEIATERKRVKNTLDNMQLGEPWHEEFMEAEDIIVEIYAPRGVIPETGAMFHILYKNADTDLLSTYVTRLYKPVRVRCTQILKVLGSPTSTELVFMLLFSAYPPKQAHITVFIVDLKTFELRDFRKDIPLTQKEYAAMSQSSVVSCDITRTFGPTGTEYLFMMISGQLVGYSVTTGQLVIKTGQMGFEFDNTDYTDLDPLEDEEEDEDDEENVDKPPEKRQGCVISPSQLAVPEDSQCTAVCFEGKIFCVVHAPKFNKMVVLTFEDKNVYNDRRAMWKTYTGLKDSKLVPAELRVDTANKKLPDVQHPAVAARKILMGKLDLEMRKAGLVRDHPKTIRKILLNDKVENYRMLEKDVTESALLEKEGVMAKRAPSRLSTAPVVEEENF